MFANTSNESNIADTGYRHYSAHDQIMQIYAGAISGCLTRFLTQPIDVLKIRFQLQVEPLSQHDKSKYKSITQACKLIYREEGLPGFWKGHICGQYLTIFYSIFQFWTFEQTYLILSQAPQFKNHDNGLRFTSGAIAGVSATFFSNPFDVLRTRFVAQDHGQGYKSILGAFPRIVREEGMKGLFRGYGISVIQIAPMVGSNFMFYHIFNDFALQMLQPEGHRLDSWCLLLTGGASGCASKLAVYPLDFIKKRLQVVGFEENRRTYGRTQSSTGILDCMRITLRDEGILGFYKGMWPTLIKSALTTAFYFTFYDKFKVLLIDEA